MPNNKCLIAYETELHYISIDFKEVEEIQVADSINIFSLKDKMKNSLTTKWYYFDSFFFSYQPQENKIFLYSIRKEEIIQHCEKVLEGIGLHPSLSGKESNFLFVVQFSKQPNQILESKIKVAIKSNLTEKPVESNHTAKPVDIIFLLN